MGNAKAMKVLKIVGNVVIWLIVAFAVVTTIFAFAARNGEDGLPTIGKTCYLTVQSDSMSPTFKTGDMLISRYLVGTQDIFHLQKGQVITFRADKDIDGNGKKDDMNTHRIVGLSVDENGAVVEYYTQGDNREMSKIAEAVKPGDVVAVWTETRIGGVGKVVNFLQTRLGFGLCIVLPMLLFFIYEVYRFIMAMIAVKNTGKKQITAADEELIKQKAVEEYLRQQAAANGEKAAAAEQSAEEAPPAEQEKENKE